MSEKYDHVLIHAESNPERGGTEIQTQGRVVNLIKMIAVIIVSLANATGMGASTMAALVLAALPDAVKHSETDATIDLGAIERAKEDLTHE